MATSSPVNFFTQQDPNFALQQLQAQRQQKIADMLTEEGAAPINYDHAGKISWTQGLAKMLQAYGGRTIGDEAIKTQAKLTAQGAQAMARAYGMGSPDQQPPAPAAQDQGQPTPQALGAAMSPQPAVQQPAQPSSGGNASPMNPYGAPPLVAYMASQGDPAALEQMKFFLAGQQKTDQMKNDAYSGVTAQQRNAMTTQETVKANNTIVGRNPDGSIKPMYIAPDVEGNVQSTVGPNGKITAGPIPGVVQARSALESGLAGAKANQSIGTVTDASGAQVPTRMGPAADAGQAQLGLTAPGPSNNVNSASAQDRRVSPAEQRRRDADIPTAIQEIQASMKAAQQTLADSKPGSSTYQNAQSNISEASAEIARLSKGSSQKGAEPQAPRLGVDPTIQAARTNQQTSMADKWKTVNDAASNAQTINSRLDTIKDLSTRASTGQMADKIQFANSLLSMAGSERANDANTAKVLIDKNANQIVAQLGQGGLGTDAARAILQSAYPNSHMPREAITEAADNLKAANQMMVAKSKVLQPHYQKNDPASYQQKESDFNSAADPSIFQWKALSSNPEAQKAFAAKLLKQDPQAPAKIHTLEQLGAFK